MDPRVGKDEAVDRRWPSGGDLLRNLRIFTGYSAAGRRRTHGKRGFPDGLRGEGTGICVCRSWHLCCGHGPVVSGRGLHRGFRLWQSQESAQSERGRPRCGSVSDGLRGDCTGPVFKGSEAALQGNYKIGVGDKGHDRIYGVSACAPGQYGALRMSGGGRRRTQALYRALRDASD